MKEESLDLSQLVGILRRNWFTLCILPLIGTVIAVAVALYLPKKFKSTAVLNIQASYFQNPLINDLIAQVNDASELQSQRMSLLRLALNEEFINQLGVKHGVFKTSASDPMRALERELFEKTIEYFSMSSTNFQVAASAETPDEAQAITSDVLAQMKRTLINERYSNLNKTRDAIKSHVDTLSNALRLANNPNSAEMLSEELEKVEITLRGLLTKFSDSHPDVLALRQQEEALRLQIKGVAGKSSSAPDGVEIGQISKGPTQEVFNELLKKLNYLTVVLDMEKDKQNVSYLGVIEQPSRPLRPVFPDKRLFAAVGLGAGLFLSILITFLVEVRRNAYVSPFDAAKRLDVPLLGELPPLLAKPGSLMLPSPSPNGSRKALPEREVKRLPAS